MFIVAPSRCGSPGKSGHGQWIRSCIWELCSRFSSSFARRISKTAKNVNNRSFVRADNFFFIRMQWMDFSPNDRKISTHSSYKKTPTRCICGEPRILLFSRITNYEYIIILRIYMIIITCFLSETQFRFQTRLRNHTIYYLVIYTIVRGW